MTGMVKAGETLESVLVPEICRSSLASARIGVVAIGPTVLNPCGFDSYMHLRGQEYFRRGYIGVESLDEAGREQIDEYDEFSAHYLFRAENGLPYGSIRFIHWSENKGLPLEKLFSKAKLPDDVQRSLGARAVEVSRVIARVPDSRRSQKVISREIMANIVNYGYKNGLDLFAIMEAAGARAFERLGGVFERLTDFIAISEYGNTENALYRLLLEDAIGQNVDYDHHSNDPDSLVGVWTNVISRPMTRVELTWER